MADGSNSEEQKERMIFRKESWSRIGCQCMIIIIIRQMSITICN